MRVRVGGSGFEADLPAFVCDALAAPKGGRVVFLCGFACVDHVADGRDYLGVAHAREEHLVHQFGARGRGVCGVHRASRDGGVSGAQRSWRPDGPAGPGGGGRARRGIVVCRGVVVGSGRLVVGGDALAVAAVTTVGVRGRARLVLIGRSRRVVGGGVVGERPPLSRAKPGAWRPGQGQGGHSPAAPAHREKIGGRGQHRRGGGATRRRQLTVPGCCVLGSSV